MSDLRELYQEVILDHARRPRNHRELPGARRAVGLNPLCGDRVTVFVEVAGGRIRDVAFQGVGCAISQASASVLTEALRGQTAAEVQRLYERFHDLVTGAAAGPEAEALGKLAVFSGVKEFPARVKCASLAWHALHEALKGEGGTTTTEDDGTAADPGLRRSGP
jgi:nitrogen fixation NifU-like protein